MKIEFPCSEYIGQFEEIKAKQAELNREIGNFSAVKENFSVQEKSGILKNIYDIRKELKESLTEVMMELAADYIGHENFFGLKEIKSALDIEVSLDKIPSIPFSKEDLERARQLDQFLVLRINKASDGEPLTIQKITEIKDNKSTDGVSIFSVNNDEKNFAEDFFVNETPRHSWALVTREVVEGTVSKDFLEQLEVLVQYLEKVIYEGKKLPQEYIDAIKQYREHMLMIKQHWSVRTSQILIQIINALKVTKLLRRSAVEIVYDSLLVSDGKFGPEKLLDHTFDSSFSFSEDSKNAVLIYHFGDGFHIFKHTLNSSFVDVGACFSRSF